VSVRTALKLLVAIVEIEENLTHIRAMARVA
jgi:hypothetical protein